MWRLEMPDMDESRGDVRATRRDALRRREEREWAEEEEERAWGEVEQLAAGSERTNSEWLIKAGEEDLPEEIAVVVAAQEAEEAGHNSTVTTQRPRGCFPLGGGLGRCSERSQRCHADGPMDVVAVR